jgi:dephospho-CoA kinase
VLKVAVTGGAGTGKTVVCDYFGRLGAHVISLDDLAREAVKSDSPVLVAISDHFGKGILRANGSLDRRKLRGIIIRDGRAREILENLTHPEIFRLFEEKVDAIKSCHEGAVVVVEIPLLIELGIQDQFDVVVLVEAGSDLQKSRLMARDGSSSAEVQALLGIQMAVDKKRPYADHIVKNQGLLKETEIVVKGIYRKITESA